MTDKTALLAKLREANEHLIGAFEHHRAITEAIEALAAQPAATVDEAADALEAARADAGRLDWLDAQRGNDVQGSYPEEPQLVGHYWSIDGQCTDVRTAIDAAMAAEGRE